MRVPHLSQLFHILMTRKSHRWLNLFLRLRPVHRPAKRSKAVHRNVSATSASSVNSQATTHSAAVSTISYTTVPGTPEENGGGVLWNQVSSAGLSDGDDTEERKAAISSDRKSVYRTAKV